MAINRRTADQVRADTVAPRVSEDDFRRGLTDIIAKTDVSVQDIRIGDVIQGRDENDIVTLNLPDTNDARFSRLLTELGDGETIVGDGEGGFETQRLPAEFELNFINDDCITTNIQRNTNIPIFEADTVTAEDWQPRFGADSNLLAAWRFSTQGAARLVWNMLAVTDWRTSILPPFGTTGLTNILGPGAPTSLLGTSGQFRDFHEFDNSTVRNNYVATILDIVAGVRDANNVRSGNYPNFTVQLDGRDDISGFNFPQLTQAQAEAGGQFVIYISYSPNNSSRNFRLFPGAFADQPYGTTAFLIIDPINRELRLYDLLKYGVPGGFSGGRSTTGGRNAPLNDPRAVAGIEAVRTFHTTRRLSAIPNLETYRMDVYAGDPANPPTETTFTWNRVASTATLNDPIVTTSTLQQFVGVQPTPRFVQTGTISGTRLDVQLNNDCIVEEGLANVAPVVTAVPTTAGRNGDIVRVVNDTTTALYIYNAMLATPAWVQI